MGETVFTVLSSSVASAFFESISFMLLTSPPKRFVIFPPKRMEDESDLFELTPNMGAIFATPETVIFISSPA